MEKILSDDERIRRAEDVLERRRNNKFDAESEIDVNMKDKKIARMLLRILICLILYGCFYGIKMYKNDEANVALSSIKNVLEYDVNFYELFDKANLGVKSWIDKITNTNSNDNNGKNEVEVVDESNIEKNNVVSSIANKILEAKKTETLGIGGELSNGDTISSSILTEEEQMEADAMYIKSKYQLVNPLPNGIITSSFGPRESSSIVSANHRGIDLGASTGTIIVSSLNGTVEEASSNGDFGTHLIIKNDGVTMIYGHCSELLVNEGDYVEAGQQIAKVGSTGKATGPHLHFEIRAEGRAIDPQMLLEF